MSALSAAASDEDGDEISRLRAEIARLRRVVASGRAAYERSLSEMEAKVNHIMFTGEPSLVMATREPKSHKDWIYEYPGNVFVVFDPMTNGESIAGAARTLAQAESILEAACPALRQLSSNRVHEMSDLREQRDELLQVLGFVLRTGELGYVADGIVRKAMKNATQETK